jgi:hypothetical protein
MRAISAKMYARAEPGLVPGESLNRKLPVQEILTSLTTPESSICCGFNPVDNNRYNEYISGCE